MFNDILCENMDHNPNDTNIPPLPTPLPPLHSTEHEDVNPPPTQETTQFTTPASLPALETSGLTTDGEVPTEVVVAIRRARGSRKNFGVKLCRHLFPTDVRATSNVPGSLNERKLDPKKMGAIRRAVFTMWSLEL